MSLQPRPTMNIPEETRRVAQAAFPKGNLYMRMRDEFGALYTDRQFAALFPERGQPAEVPGRLALVTVMQFAEGLSDRQAAEAVRARIDWKYALGLELTDPGFDHSILSEFRERLLDGRLEQDLLDVLLAGLKKRGLLKAKGSQRTDSTHVLAAIRTLNRLELVGEAMRRALNELTVTAPDWVRSVAKSEWFVRYAQRFDSLRLPKEKAEREALIETIGRDGHYLLSVLYESPAGPPLRQLEGVEILRRIWVQQYWVDNQADGTHQIRLRAEDNQPPGDKRIQSPYDLEARYSTKRDLEWVGYKAYLTETCNDDTVHLITHVEVTAATVQDVSVTDTIHTALAEKDLLPSEHLMDAGFIDADVLVAAKRDLAIEVCGPVKKDPQWQALAGQGFGLSNFVIDWEARTVTCPKGQRTTSWSGKLKAYRPPTIQVEFKASVCQACSSREQCTRAKRGGRRLGFQPQAQHEALQQARQTQSTPAFWKKYAKRSGIEGTISQAVRVCEVRRSRYIGLAKTRLQMLATAAAINLHRVYDWLTEVPRSLTRTTLFASLAPKLSLVLSGWHA